MRRLWKNRSVRIGSVMVTVILLIALTAPFLAPNDPYKVNVMEKLENFSIKYPLGSDHMGRCVLSRLLYGTRLSIFTALGALGLTVTIGFLLGLAAGFCGGIADRVIMWLCDVVLAFPGMLLALVIVGISGPGIFHVMLAMAFTSWASFARVTRSYVLSEKKSDYVKAAVSSGTTSFMIAVRHIIPNVASPILVMAVSMIGSKILSIAGLSFIGLGAQAPQAEWGTMITDGKSYLELAPHLVLAPILAIFITVFGFNLLGDGLQHVWNPKNQGK